jgi:hypothetical protein
MTMVTVRLLLLDTYRSWSFHFGLRGKLFMRFCRLWSWKLRMRHATSRAQKELERARTKADVYRALARVWEATALLEKGY